MRIAVVGAGAMGSITAYLLSAGDTEVVIFEKRPERVEEINRNGIRLRGDLSGQAFIDSRLRPEEDRPFDLIILSVNAAFGPVALRPLSPFVHRNTLYLSLQEGSAVEELAGIVGDERAAGGISSVSAVELPTGEVEVEELRSIHFAGYLPTTTARLEPLLVAIGAIHEGKVELTENFDTHVWSRLQSAGPVSGLCAILDAVPEEIRGLDEVDSICMQAAEECRQVAAGLGEDLRATSPWDDAVWRWIKPPMLRDLEAGRKTEIGVLGAHVVKWAGAQGRAVPITGALVSLMKEMESGKVRPGEGAFKELRRRMEEERGMRLL